jgi:signal transduction histidine kinase
MDESSSDRSVINEIIQRIEGLDAIVNDLLLYARPRQARLIPLKIRDLVEETVQLLQSDPEFKRVHFEVSGSDPLIACDPDLLRHVIINILVNAAQAQRDGIIHIKITSLLQEAVLEFSDKGPGIPSEIRDRVFEPFFTTKPKGSGLELSIAKRLIDAHHGKIEIACPVTGGTTVRVRLPISMGTSPGAPKPADSAWQAS